MWLPDVPDNFQTIQKRASINGVINMETNVRQREQIAVNYCLIMHIKKVVKHIKI